MIDETLAHTGGRSNRVRARDTLEGICPTVLKKICRKHGVPRWPNRHLKSLAKQIRQLETVLQSDMRQIGELSTRVVRRVSRLTLRTKKRR